jgi:hypothetical protein
MKPTGVNLHIARTTALALAAVAALLVFAVVVGADDALPFVIGGGAGAVYDSDNDFGWLFRLNGSGHPGGLSWFQLGLEMQYFGRTERVTEDKKEEITGGTRRTQRWSADGGILVGALTRFPFGFGPREKNADGEGAAAKNVRGVFDLAPMLSGGLYIDGETTRETITTDTASGGKVKMNDDQGGTSVKGAYLQAGGRFRWTVLETGIGAQFMTDRPVQGVLWLGFDAPW